MKRTPLLIILLLTPALAGCTGLFFVPDRQYRLAPEVQALGPRDVFFNSPDGLRLHGLYIRHQGPERQGVVLACHGNKGNLSAHIPLDLWLVQSGYDIFIFDYRGYGLSEGEPGIDGIHMDAEAALETLLKMPENSGERVIVYGKSLGGAIAIHTVAVSEHKERIRALIAESAFADYRMMARHEVARKPTGWVVMYPASLLVSNRYSPLKWIGSASPAPVLIMHGTDDKIVPVEHGRLLYEAAREPGEYWEVKGMGHIRVGDNPAIRERLLRYLESTDNPPSSKDRHD